MGNCHTCTLLFFFPWWNVTYPIAQLHTWLILTVPFLIVLNQKKWEQTINWFDCLEAGQLRYYLFGCSSIPLTCQLARNHPGLFGSGWWISRGRIGGGVFCGGCLLLMLFDIPALLSALSSKCSSCSDILRGSLVWAAVSISPPSLPLSLPPSLSSSLHPLFHPLYLNLCHPF